MIGGVISLQFLVPMVALTTDPPTRFGFQMYSGLGNRDVIVRDSGGEQIDVDLGDHLPAGMRADVVYTRALGEFLCRRVSGAAEVELSHTSKSWIVAC